MQMSLWWTYQGKVATVNVWRQLAMKQERIVYVSCDLATQARDLWVIVDGWYELRMVRGIHQFWWTMHVETVALLSHKVSDKTREL